MKKVIVTGLLFVFIIGCNFETFQEEPYQGKEDIEGFVETEEYEEYAKPITEYMYYRTQSVLKNDIKLLWDHYPLLRENSDPQNGVNIEGFEVESLNEGFNLLDANFNIESYDQLKVKEISNNEVIVLVHGSISYIREDFTVSGGEYLIKVFLGWEDNKWTVKKTDEYTLPEYKEWQKNQERE
ncbi:hypothetical protein [Bacillus sp. AK128]